MPFRLIFWLITIIITALLPDSRIRSAYPGRRYNRFYGVFEDDFEGGMRIQPSGSNSITDTIRKNLRRRNALKKSKAYLTKEKYILTLKNKNVILIMDTNNYTMTCLDQNVKGRSATVAWQDQPVSQLEEIDNEFDRIFDSICISFNDKANYKGIVGVLETHFNINETDPSPKKPAPISITEDDKPIKLTSKHIKVVNINSADENEIAKLPGINIITAKRIIKYRDEQGEFSSVEEICRIFKIKAHFQEKLEHQISFNKVGEKKNKKQTNERIIDF